MTDNNKNINAEELELFGGEDFVFTKDQKGNIVAKGLNPMGQSEEIEQTLSILLENK